MQCTSGLPAARTLLRWNLVPTRSRTMRIAVGGFQHETNTFAPSKADYNAFESGRRLAGADLRRRDRAAPRRREHSGDRRDRRAARRRPSHAGPRVGRGVAVGARHRATRSSASSARSCAASPRRGRSTASTSTCTARWSPSTSTTAKARSSRACARSSAPHVPIVASLDLHANVTRAMMERADGLVAYRTYPHVDMAATGERAAQLLLERTRAAGTPLGARRAAARLPHRAVVAVARSSSRRGACTSCSSSSSASTTSCSRSRPAFRWPTSPSARWRCSATGPTRRACSARSMRCAHAVADAEPEFALELLDAGRSRGARARSAATPGAPGRARRHPGQSRCRRQRRHHRPARGADASATRRDAVLGLLIDPASAKQAHEVGVGRTARVQARRDLGRRRATCRSPASSMVERARRRPFTCTGPMFKGFRMELGPMARAAHAATCASCSRRSKVQAADQEMFRHVGIEPIAAAHPRAQELGALPRRLPADRAARCWSSSRPGPAKADPTMFRWTRLRGLR